MISKLKKFVPLAALLPAVALAQSGGGLDNSINTIQNLITKLIPIVIAIALLVFLWGLVKYLWSASDEDKKGAVKLIITGIVILFVMVGVWGLVNILGQTLGVSTQGGDNVVAPPVPQPGS